MALMNQDNQLGNIKMNAITVKVIPATNTKPTRYKAFANGVSFVYSAPLEDIDPFTNAAKKFAQAQGWLNCGEWVGGTFDSGVVFVSTLKSMYVQEFLTFTLES